MKKLIKIFFVCALCIVLSNSQEVFARGGTSKDEFVVNRDEIGSSVVTTTIKCNFCGAFIYNKPQDPNALGNSNVLGVVGTVDRVWTTVLLIVQIISVACVVLTGVRYMFASADQKADLKKGVMYLIIGSAFVFATSTIIKFIYFSGSEIIK